MRVGAAAESRRDIRLLFLPLLKAAYPGKLKSGHAPVRGDAVLFHLSVERIPRYPELGRGL